MTPELHPPDQIEKEIMEANGRLAKVGKKIASDATTSYVPG